MTNIADLVRLLDSGGVEFIIAGGVAATMHGSARVTQDLDIVYSRQKDNLRKLVEALHPHQPYLRGAPRGLPFRFDIPTLTAGLNFTLETDLGWIDLLGEITGGGRYEDLLPHAEILEVFGRPCRVLNMDTLIRTKRAAGRPKDIEAIAELELLRDHARQ